MIYTFAYPILLSAGQSVLIPRHSQACVKNAGLVTLETLEIIILRNIIIHKNV